MLVTISFATAINTKNEEKKESPLFNIRTLNSINKEKLNNFRQNIITRFFGNRLFFALDRIVTVKDDERGPCTYYTAGESCCYTNCVVCNK